MLSWEQSRVSHHLTRMGTAAWSSAPSAPRTAVVPSSASPRRGAQAIEQAAPGHVAAVRRLVFDVLDEGDVAALGVAVDKMLDALDTGAAVRR